jgi:hypothetical protein
MGIAPGWLNKILDTMILSMGSQSWLQQFYLKSFFLFLTIVILDFRIA